jgi:hypothetical protein
MNSLGAISDATERFDVFILKANLIAIDINKPPSGVTIAVEPNSWGDFIKGVIVCILNEL